jgi:hypothetical protein
MWAAFFILMSYKVLKPQVPQATAARQGKARLPVYPRRPVGARVGFVG